MFHFEARSKAPYSLGISLTPTQAKDEDEGNNADNSGIDTGTNTGLIFTNQH